MSQQEHTLAKLPGVLDLVFYFVKSPSGALGLVCSLLGLKVTQSGFPLDFMDGMLWLGAAVVAVAFIQFLLRALPEVLHVVMIWCGTIIVSMLTMGWCVNNHDRCQSYFMYTQDKVLFAQELAEDLVLKIYGNWTRPLK